MTKTIRNILGLVLSLVALALGYAAVRYVSYYSQSIQTTPFRNFTVTGQAKVTVLPDVAEFNFQVINEGNKDIAALQKANTATTNKAISYLKSQGIADKDIKTEAYNLSPRYQNTNCRSTGNILCAPPSIVGYTINQQVSVKIHDFSKIGDIMSGIIKNGANKVSSLNFTIDDPTAAENEARTKAINNAKAEAEAIANAGGFTVGRLLSIHADNPYPVYNTAAGIGGGLDMRAEATPTIQPGSQDVSANVTLQYEIR